MASISSMKIIAGAAAAAAANSWRILASDSPETPATISGAAMEKNGTPASRAMACARVVLPQPGGPRGRDEAAMAHASTFVHRTVLALEPFWHYCSFFSTVPAGALECVGAGEHAVN
jgi:hypothetical protein